MKAAYYTLGCKVNRYETEAMREQLETAGFDTVAFEQSADVYLINTCTVTAVADKKSRQMIRRAAGRKRPGGALIVCGCMAQQDAVRVMEMEGVDAVLGTSNKLGIADVVAQVLDGGTSIALVASAADFTEYEPIQISKSHERTRANIKICDGCNNFCSYCIIPYARGRVRSRPLMDVVAEAERLAAAGVLEVVLTGIHVSSYGQDLENSSFIDVLEALEQVEGIARIRLSSLEPTLLTDAFCKRAAKLKKLCPHFHVSLQSGSTPVLARMNRNYTADEYRTYIKTLRKHFEDPAVTTDVIVGFQGESEQEHRQSMQLIEDIGFSSIHVFPYSKRDGTAASRMQGDISGSVKKARANEAIALGHRLEEVYRKRYTDTIQAVLFEQMVDETRAEGYTPNYLKVVAEAKPNRLYRVRLNMQEEKHFIGEIEEEIK